MNSTKKETQQMQIQPALSYSQTRISSCHKKQNYLPETRAKLFKAMHKITN